MRKEISNAFGKIFLTVEYVEKANYVHNNWLGYQTLDSIVSGANSCIEEIKRSRCAYLLNDNRLVVGPWDHATDWIANDWTPRAINAGLTHFAHIVSPESFAALSAETMSAKIGEAFHMRIFGDFDEARQWIKEAQQLKLNNELSAH